MYVWFAVKTLFCTCLPDHKSNNFEKVRAQYKISKIGKLPGVVNESSGLARSADGKFFWTHNDSGGKTEIYGFDAKGKLIAVKPVPNSKNTDWEELAEDGKGTIFIGDMGNNGTPRSELQIYAFNTQTDSTEQISFKYKNRPATLNGRPNADCEAFFYHKDQLYLFSKNWQKDGLTWLYKMPAKPGKYELAPSDSIRITSQVTAADISPDGKSFVLLTYAKILLFEVSPEGINFNKPVGCFQFKQKQTEAILFLNNTDMMVTNEQGDMYLVTRE